MKYIDYFIDSSKPLIKPRFVAVEEDWNLVLRVFPEPGFRSYFLGYLISTFANELRKRNITGYETRLDHRDFADLRRFLSNVSFTGDQSGPDDRRGAGSFRDEHQSSSGESTDHENPSQREGKDSEEASGNSETEPKASGFVSYRKTLIGLILARSDKIAWGGSREELEKRLNEMTTKALRDLYLGTD